MVLFLFRTLLDVILFRYPVGGFNYMSLDVESVDGTCVLIGCRVGGFVDSLYFTKDPLSPFTFCLGDIAGLSLMCLENYLTSDCGDLSSFASLVPSD